MMSQPLIDASNTWALWAVLLAAAATGFLAERTQWGRRLSGAVIAIATTFVLSNVGIIPASAPVYDVVWSYLVPLAIPLLLFRADLRRILREAGPTLGAFALGTLGTVVGTLVAFQLVDLGPEGPKLAGIFCATYVGGSMNYAAVAEVLELRSGNLLTAGIAADNLIMTLYFLVLFALPSIGWLRRSYPQRARNAALAQVSVGAEEQGPTVTDMASALALAAVACATGYGIQNLSGLPGTGILWITLLMVFAATAFPRHLTKIRGSDRLGTLLMQVFFATIGASANIRIVLEYGPKLMLFAALILIVHLTFLLVGGRLFRLDLAELVIASNANIGGATTSAAMAAARQWSGLVIPAILCGTLGYAIATFIGVAVGRFLAP